MTLRSSLSRRARWERLEPRRLLTVTVDTLDDVVDPADDLTSLREAIVSAQDGETIVFSFESNENEIVLDPAHGALLIERSLSIEGPEVGELAIRGGSGFRVFIVDDGDDATRIDVALSRLTIADGDVDGPGGGVFNEENLSITDSQISGNVGSLGGGVYSRTGDLIIEQSRILGNSANGGFQGGGGVHHQLGNLTIRSSTLSGNTASDGGGVLSAPGASGLTSIVGSTINANTASDSGGGVYLVDGMAEISSSTISGNSALDSGGGFYNLNANVAISYSTIAENEGRSGRGGGASGNGSLSGMTEIRGSIIANNLGGGDMMGVGFYDAASDMFISTGYNLVGVGNVLDVMVDTDLIGVVDAGLEPLADNGGATHTHALREDSPAVDAGNPNAAGGAGGVPMWDQRDSPYRRVFDGDSNESIRIDIGAYELNWPADLSITKVVEVIVDIDPVERSTANEQQSVVYTITAANAASSRTPATGVEVLDNLPDSLSIVSFSASEGSYDSGVWSGLELNPGEIQTLVIEAFITTGSAGALIANRAVIAGNEIDPDPSNNEATASLTVNSVDLFVAKSVDDPTPNAEQEITYTIVATNSDSSNSAATGVEVADSIPSNVLVLSHEATEGVYDNGIWSGLELAPGESQTLLITATLYQAAPGETLVNTAIITGNETDPNLSNNEDSATVTLNSVDLSVSKTVDSGAVGEGETVLYTITAQNSIDSNAVATGVEVLDDLPDVLSIVTFSASEGDYENGVWSGLELDPGETQTLVIEAIVATGSAGAQISNTAVIFGNEEDPDSSNNEATASLTVNSVDLLVTKSVDDATPNAEQEIVYTIVATNSDSSNSAATGVEVTDGISEQLFVDAVEATEGVYDNGIWSGLELAPGESQTLRITATLYQATPGETLVNSAIITGNETDPDLSNNEDSATITLNSVDLSVANTVEPDAVFEGETVLFTITAQNSANSNAVATGVEVVDSLPDELSIVSFDPSEGSYDSGVWNGFDLAPGETQTLTIEAIVAPETGDSTLASNVIISGNETDPDLINNAAAASLNVEQVQADLAVAKTVDNATPFFGEPFEFTVSAENLETSNVTASGVVVEDLLPPGLTLVSFDMLEGAYDPVQGLWTGLELDPGETQVLTIVAILDEEISGEPIVNTAAISGNELDLDLSNNMDVAEISPQFAPSAIPIVLLGGDFNQDGAVDALDISDASLGFSARFGRDLAGGDFLSWQRQLNIAAIDSVTIRTESKVVLATAAAAIKEPATSARQFDSPYELAAAALSFRLSDVVNRDSSETSSGGDVEQSESTLDAGQSPIHAVELSARRHRPEYRAQRNAEDSFGDVLVDEAAWDAALERSSVGRPFN